jgi:hypothetical protein
MTKWWPGFNPAWLHVSLMTGEFSPEQASEVWQVFLTNKHSNFAHAHLPPPSETYDNPNQALDYRIHGS